MTKTFKRITNDDIYNTLLEMKKKLADIENHVLVTNDKVRLNKWMAGTAVLIAVTAIGMRVLG